MGGGFESQWHFIGPPKTRSREYWALYGDHSFWKFPYRNSEETVQASLFVTVEGS